MFSFREAVEKLLSRQKFSMLEASYVRGSVEDKLRSCAGWIEDIIKGLEDAFFGVSSLDTVLGGLIDDLEEMSDEEWEELYGDVARSKKEFIKKIDGWLERVFFEAHDPLVWIESCLKGVYKEIADFLGEPYEIDVEERKVVRRAGRGLFEELDLDVRDAFDRAESLLDDVILVLGGRKEDVEFLLREYKEVLRPSWARDLREAVRYFDEEIKRIEKLRSELLRIRPK